MASLFMLMGLPGSGKSTMAQRLAAERSAFLLVPDVWLSRIVGSNVDHTEPREVVKAIQLEVAERVLRLGGDVVLEFGFFSRAERDAVRAWALGIGATPHLVFLDLPFDELLRRTKMRNASLPPHTFPVSREHLEYCATLLERPGADELLWAPPYCL
jgi:predicted kinase